MRNYGTCAAVLSMAALSGVFGSVGCEEKKPAGASTASPAEDHEHAPGDGHAHAPGDGHAHGEDEGHGHGVAVIALGEQNIGPFLVKATRDVGEVVAGKDAPIDVVVTPAPDSGVTAASVRFWIGTEDAKGSVKARADVEDPKEPNRWHTHAEVPNPLPPESKLWVEIEDDKGGKSVGSFGLMM